MIVDLMTDFLTGYVVRVGEGLAGDPGLKASRHSTGGALSVFEASIGAGRRCTSMTAKMSALMSATASCRPLRRRLRRRGGAFSQAAA